MEEDRTDTHQPEWWAENERLRESLDLPAYDPPRFLDGVYTHTVVSALEDEYDCTVRFIGINVEYGDDWKVLVDGEVALTLGRHRDTSGNTVYEIRSGEFQDAVAEKLRSDR